MKQQMYVGIELSWNYGADSPLQAMALHLRTCKDPEFHVACSSAKGKAPKMSLHPCEANNRKQLPQSSLSQTSEENTCFAGVNTCNSNRMRLFIISLGPGVYTDKAGGKYHCEGRFDAVGLM